MERRLRPVLGFGALGWALLPVAAALVFCILGGYDLRFAIQRWWFERFGWDGLLWLTTDLQFRYSISMWSPVLGPVCLTYLLPALFLSPRRWGRWVWCVAVVAPLVLPWFWWEFGNGRFSIGGWWPPAGVRFALSGAICGLMVGAGLWWIGRSMWLTGVFAGATLAALIFELYTVPVVGVPAWVQRAAPVTWHVLFGVALLAWAVQERRRAADPWACRRCGYDLRGVGAGRCPECGGGGAGC